MPFQVDDGSTEMVWNKASARIFAVLASHPLSVHNGETHRHHGHPALHQPPPPPKPQEEAKAQGPVLHHNQPTLDPYSLPVQNHPQVVSTTKRTFEKDGQNMPTTI